MVKKKHKPHDAFVKALLSDPVRAKVFLLRLLPPRVSDRLDLDSLEAEDRIQGSGAGAERQLDALFRVRLRRPGRAGQDALLSILLEHKSYRDRWTTLQVLGYLAAAYEAQRAARLPLRPIIPCVFRHGKGRWRLPDVRALFWSGHGPFLDYVPTFNVLYTDLGGMSEEEIGQMGEAWLRSALLTQKYSHDPAALMARFERIFTIPPEPSAGNFLQILMVYFSKLVSISRDAFRDLVYGLPEHKQPNIMTLYDSILEEGIEKGIEQGIERGIEQGIERGIEQGIERGIEQGIEQGIERGIEKAKKQTVLSGYKNGISIEILCLLTGYSEVQVWQILSEAADADHA
jgi:predicted transposase/invertase (TIGR01784 family)